MFKFFKDRKAEVDKTDATSLQLRDAVAKNDPSLLPPFSDQLTWHDLASVFKMFYELERAKYTKRKVHSIDVGNLSAEQVKKAVNKMRAEHKTKLEAAPIEPDLKVEDPQPEPKAKKRNGTKKKTV